MTEIEEVAIAMIPEYFKMLKEEGKAPSVIGISTFVVNNMSATESFNVMDGVANYMVNTIMPIRTREDGKLAHAWIKGEYLGLPESSLLYNQMVCRDCGVVKGHPDHPETACKGRVSVTTR